MTPMVSEARVVARPAMLTRARRDRVLCRWTVLCAVLLGCGGDGTAPPAPHPVPASIQLSASALDLASGGSERLVATVKDRTGAVVSPLPPGVSLTWSSSDVSRVSVDATGLVQAIRPGAATVTAAVGTLTAAAAVTVRGEVLAGSPTDPAATAIQEKPFVARAEDYSLGHPALPGMHLSFNTMALSFTAGATVAQANAVLAPLQAEIVGAIPGAGSAPGILFLRLPATTHAHMEAALLALRGNAAVRTAVQDGLGALSALPSPGAGTPSGWQWDLPPAGGNYGLELVRAPQMWNLNAALRKAAAPRTVVGVLDGGFAAHSDLAYRANLTPSGTTPAPDDIDHGTHVAGTIAARHEDGGVVGVTPFADLVVEYFKPPVGVIAGVTQTLLSLFSDVYQLRGLITHSSRPQVINLSLALTFCAQTPPINSDTDAPAQAYATDLGRAISDMLAGLDAQGFRPLLVAAAGNCAGRQTRWDSHYANAAIVHGAPNILIVESVANAPGLAGGGTRSSFSNVGGDVSAPGGGASDQVLSTAATVPYKLLHGTSMAAPHVTGLAAYLWSVDPQLLPGQVRGLLLNHGNTVAVGGGATPRVDAFSTVLDIDRLRGNNRVLTMLLDIDDGSLDGNRRADENGGTITDDDADQDGGPGDGAIDMSDFRRFRDWLLQTENPGGLSLDGGAQHVKKDLNGDGQVGTPAQENAYPRGDFNGDGRLDRTALTPVRGFSTDGTDLDVLRKLFVDPNYQAAQLAGLLDSGDLTVDVVSCLAKPGAVRIATSIRPKGTTSVVQSRSQTAASPRAVYTAAVTANGYTARAQAFDGANTSLGSSEMDFVLTLGGDANWKPLCADAATIDQFYFRGEVATRATRSRLPSTDCSQFASLPGTLPAPLSGALAPPTCSAHADAGNFIASVTGEQNYTATSNTAIPLTVTANGMMTASINSDGNWGLQANGYSTLFLSFRVRGGNAKLDITATIEGIMSNPLANVQAYTYCDVDREDIEGTDWEVGRPTTSGPWLPTSTQINYSTILTPEDYNVSCGAYIFVSENASGPPTAVNVSGSARFNYTLRLSPAP